jgi:hypothetical protein
MNEEKNGTCLQQVEHILGHVWHRYKFWEINYICMCCLDGPINEVNCIVLFLIFPRCWFQGESQGKKKTVYLSVVPFTSSSFDRWDVDIDIVHKSLFWDNLHQVQYTHNLKTQWESWIYFFYNWLQVIQRT